MSRRLAREWLEAAGFECEVAVVPPFKDGVDWRTADPNRYELVVFVCGPFAHGEFEAEFLARFAGRRLSV